MIDRERWEKYSFPVQMGNIASELSRAARFDEKGDEPHFKSSMLRLIELVDLTIEDGKNVRRLRELCRFKEVLADWFARTGVYQVASGALMRYTLDFAGLARR